MCVMKINQEMAELFQTPNAELLLCRTGWSQLPITGIDEQEETSASLAHHGEVGLVPVLRTSNSPISCASPHGSSAATVGL
jgi:hypothetical protein